MAVGDTVNGIVSLAAAATTDLRPASGLEWVIHNLYYSGPCELQFTDGTNTIIFDTDATSGGRLGAVFHATNTRWVRLKNTGGSTFLYGYDGVQTK